MSKRKPARLTAAQHRVLIRLDNRLAIHDANEHTIRSLQQRKLLDIDARLTAKGREVLYYYRDRSMSVQ
jgi:hypothetical protein